ncbi:unnamed protein product [Blepharisma stoltei]|uniref:Uncharacterized protein n=1 Tax=Blepharisma stoltei TaxID=1481888 RepID=A0AAU9J6Q8_9CILI|nr:unnamed protein product [Blepharisma stoltei]
MIQNSGIEIHNRFILWKISMIKNIVVTSASIIDKLSSVTYIMPPMYKDLNIEHSSLLRGLDAPLLSQSFHISR